MEEAAVTNTDYLCDDLSQYDMKTLTTTSIFSLKEAKMIPIATMRLCEAMSLP